MIYTSNYDNASKFKLDNTVSISGDKGKSAMYKGKFYKPLAPKLEMWKIWYDNINKLSEEENNDFYIREYYKSILSGLNPNEVYKCLDGKTLLCYEEFHQFCHRHIVSAWLELSIGVESLELLGNGGLYKVDDSYKRVLSKYIDK